VVTSGITPASAPNLCATGYQIIAGNLQGQTQFWHGALQHYAIFGSCLSAARISAHYAAR